MDSWSVDDVVVFPILSAICTVLFVHNLRIRQALYSSCQGASGGTRWTKMAAVLKMVAKDGARQIGLAASRWSRPRLIGAVRMSKTRHNSKVHRVKQPIKFQHGGKATSIFILAATEYPNRYKYFFHLYIRNSIRPLSNPSLPPLPPRY